MLRMESRFGHRKLKLHACKYFPSILANNCPDSPHLHLNLCYSATKKNVFLSFVEASDDIFMLLSKYRQPAAIV